MPFPPATGRRKCIIKPLDSGFRRNDGVLESESWHLASFQRKLESSAWMLSASTSFVQWRETVLAIRFESNRSMKSASYCWL